MPHAKPGDELISPEALQVLEGHAWPGNVRELANVIEHAAILRDDGPITPMHLPSRFNEKRLRGPHFKIGPTAASGATLREMEMAAIHQALDRHKGNKPKAAEELGISLKTLYNKLNQEQAEATA